ncbi:hypothetical protein P692DRAFT_201914389 [Suillus brevipes Sb2]|nr:hypothetical protein P692DRAFT_201914389 [Suillus brevipes Sb2]
MVLLVLRGPAQCSSVLSWLMRGERRRRRTTERTHSERRLPKGATDWQPKARPKTASERCTGWVTLPFLAARHQRRHLPQTVIRRTLCINVHVQSSGRPLFIIKRLYARATLQTHGRFSAFFITSDAEINLPRHSRFTLPHILKLGVGGKAKTSGQVGKASTSTCSLLSMREWKAYYSVDNYYKETLRVGPSKMEKAPKLPRAHKQIQIQDFQFFDPTLAQLQEREFAVHKTLEAERAAAQEFKIPPSH